jgi:hypothetical protein
MATKQVKLSDMRRAKAAGINVHQYCPTCQAEYSADPSDYFMADESHIFKCNHGRKGRGRNVVLVTRRTVITEWSL